MQSNQTIPISKILMFVIGISAALIISLFVLHLRYPKPQSFSSENATSFAIPRDIKPFELYTLNQQKFSQKNFYQHWTLLFFGFTHCASICPTTLTLMDRVYQKLHNTYPNLQVVFISLDPERDHVDSVMHYAQSFNPAFIGVTGKIQEIRKLQSQLGIVSFRDEVEGNHYQLQHTPSILLIDPQGRWAGIFKNGLSPDQFLEIFPKIASRS